ncbi:hypothetical protein [Gilliamella sp. BG6]|uniref:hypothetical protein n=1 Tax=unclassified Gilliamella TaxID=2685620 RepID=UPI0039884BD5
MNKQKQFIEQVIQCRGEKFNFVKLGMKVEFDGEQGTIVGINHSGNFVVKFSNELKFGKKTVSCHPTYKMKYFDENNQLIKSFN